MSHKEALAATRALIERLVQRQARAQRTKAPDRNRTGIARRIAIDRVVMFARGGRGVTLIEDDADFYQLVHHHLYTTLPAKRRAVLGPKTVEVHLQSAILAALEPEEEANVPSSIDSAMRGLTRGLTSPVTAWALYFPIAGLVVRRGHAFGGIRFRRATDSALSDLRNLGFRIISQSSSPAPTRQASAEHYRRHLQDALTNRTIATVIVDAVDQESAVRIGRQQTRTVLDVIAFCDSLVTPRTIIRLPTIDGAELPFPPAAIFNADQRLTIPSAPRGRETDLTGLLRHKHNAGLFRRISGMLATVSPTATAKRLITAMSWAGRAVGRIRPEEQFLAYLIALECLLLGTKEGELTYRLRVRCARLLGRNRSSREWIAQRVSQLYDLRSAVVHSGVRDVAAEDLSAARQFVLHSIVEVLTTRRIKKSDDLERWFNSEVLR